MTGSVVVVNVFRVLAASTSLMMILSPMPTVYRIHKTHKTGHMSIFPLLAVLFNCHAWMLYGYLDQDFFPVFTTFALGDVISLFYVVTFYRWTSKRAKTNKMLAIFSVALLATTGYGALGGLGYTGQSRQDVVQFAGYIAVVAALVLYSSPLEKVVQVFRHKSAVFLPIHMVLAGTTNNAVWVIYTTLAHKWLMFAPNMATLLVGLFQIVLYVCIYNPKSHPLSDDWKTHEAYYASEDEDDTVATPTADDDAADLESPTFVENATLKSADETHMLPHMQV
jgi:solute carrier family 50 (sugar transporter)